MKNKWYEPIKITDHFYQLGTPSFPIYLSIGENAMLLEGGTGATFRLIVEQLRSLNVRPEKIKYITLTHTHSDHIGAIPHLRKLWPHIRVMASPQAEKLLSSERTTKEFIVVDNSITEIMRKKGEIVEDPPHLEHYDFHVDELLDEGDQIELGQGIIWTVHDTPGHSSCHLSFFEEKEGILMIGDATGFYVPEKDVFWPNYFESLELYCKSIRKLMLLPAKYGALCHNGVINSNLRNYFAKAIQTTNEYHWEMLKRLENGEDISQIAIEKANWVNSLTDIQTWEVMRRLAKLLITRSQHEAIKGDVVTLPRVIS